MKLFVFLLFAALQAAVVVFVAQTSDLVAAMIVALAAGFFQLIAALAIDLI